MKSAGWYFMKGGQRVWAATKREIRKLAQAAANELGAGVTVRPAGQARKVKAKRNPAPASRARRADDYHATAVKLIRQAARLDAAGERRAAADLRSIAKEQAAMALHRRRREFKGNPDPGAMIDVLWEKERGRQARASYVARTKGQRMAKHLRNRDPAAAREAAREKTGKFVVKASNRKEAFTLYRASRAAANALARQFEAAGYDVAVREA